MRQTALILAALLLGSPALAADVARNAKMHTTPGGCACSEGAKVWACRKLIDYTLGKSCKTTPELLCSDDASAPCVIGEQTKCSEEPTGNVCIEQDKK